MTDFTLIAETGVMNQRGMPLQRAEQPPDPSPPPPPTPSDTPPPVEEPPDGNV